MLRPLIPTLREGNSHLYYKWLREGMKAFLDSVGFRDSQAQHASPETCNSGDAETVLLSKKVVSILDFCFDVVMDQYQHINVKNFIVDEIFASVLRRCDSTVLCSIFGSHTNNSYNLCVSRPKKDNVENASVLIQLMEIVSIGDTAIQKNKFVQDTLEAKLVELLCSYEILTALYDRYSLEIKLFYFLFFQ